eukprot:scaffold502_cov350-Pavlova_lutheri.AAC.20
MPFPETVAPRASTRAMRSNASEEFFVGVCLLGGGSTCICTCARFAAVPAACSDVVQRDRSVPPRSFRLVGFDFRSSSQVHERLDQSLGDLPEPVQAQSVQDAHGDQDEDGHDGGELFEERIGVVEHEQADASKHVDPGHEPDQPEERSVEQVGIGFLGPALMEEVPQVDIRRAHFGGDGSQHDEVSFFGGEAEHQAEDGGAVVPEEVHASQSRVVLE